MPLGLLIGRIRWRMETHRGHAVKILTGWLILMAALHVAAMMIIEDMGLCDAVWLTFVTATTIGYGDVSAKTPWGRTATITIMCFGTIFVAAALASLLFDRAAERRSRKDAGKWRWNLNEHLLIVSTTGTETVRYLTALVGQIRHDARYAESRIAIMTTGFDKGLPDSLRDLDCVYLRGDGDTTEELRLAHADRAHTIVVLGESRQPKADALVYDVTRRLRDHGFQGRIVAEVAEDANRARMCDRSDDSCVRPVRGYPEILARAVVSPGAERVIEDLSTAGGAECESVRLDYAGGWMDLCMIFMRADLGMPIGYRGDDGTIVTAPSGSEEVRTTEVYVVTSSAGDDLQRRVDDMSELKTGGPA